MQRNAWKTWAAAGLSAGLLELPFPLAGPLPPARGIVAWFALAPLLWAIFSAAESSKRPLRASFLVGYICGVLWYAGNCYWIYDTMRIHGDMPPALAAFMLVGFSAVLGGYFGLFGLGVALIGRRAGTGAALIAAPLLWVALDLVGARFTSVPWDQLGYSQIDNSLITQIAPLTGVYGITFVLVAANALLAGGVVLTQRAHRIRSVIAAVLVIAAVAAGLLIQPAKPPAPATAVLVQPNLDVSVENLWNTPSEWNSHIAQFTRLAEEQCKTYISGIPQTGAPTDQTVCPPNATHPDLVAWPEAPAMSFFEADPRFVQTMSALARSEQTTLIVGGVGADFSSNDNLWHDYNSAMLFGADGQRIGRYDKIHLVPFGEYVPYRDLFFFAHKLTGKVSDFSRGTSRTLFRIPDQHGQIHSYGIFICYESVFAEEVRHFAQHGAEVLVNISDDGWYGDTSAPWQHLNQARMRAVENRRWILRDTNTGITAVIDPYGRVRQSIPRHQVDALPAQFGFRDDVTFYSAHGDVFAWCCAILYLGIVLWAFKFTVRSKVQLKVRS
jgi:apolipoprotein N-acyltransferase